MMSTTFRETVDVTQVAGLLSQLAGLLGAFSFTAVLLLLERFASNRRLESALAALMSSFMSLLVAAFLYAVVAGETSRGPRAYAMNAVAAIVMATGLLMMVSGLTHLLTAARPTVFSGVLKLLVLAVPVTTLAYVDVAFLDLIGAIQDKKVAADSPYFAMALVPTLALVALVAVMWARWQAPPAALRWASRPRVQTVFERTVLLVLVTLIVGAAVLSRVAEDLPISPGLIGLGPLLFAIGLALYTVGLHARVAPSVAASTPAQP